MNKCMNLIKSSIYYSYLYPTLNAMACSIQKLLGFKISKKTRVIRK